MREEFPVLREWSASSFRAAGHWRKGNYPDKSVFQQLLRFQHSF